MDKLSKLMLSRAQKLQNYLQNLLENDKLKPLKEQNEDGTEKVGFEITTDLSHIDDIGMGLPNKLNDRVQMLFSRLSVYFESGMLFKLQADKKTWNPQAAFQEGDFYPLLAEDLLVHFEFPKMTLVEILKLKESNLEKTLKQIGLVTEKDTQILAFKPHPEYIFLITSLLPDPWLKTQSEKIQTKLLVLLGDY